MKADLTFCGGDGRQDRGGREGALSQIGLAFRSAIAIRLGSRPGQIPPDRFLRAVLPQRPEVPGTDLGDYFKLIDQRFSNPKIGDTVRRLCLDGSNRQPKFIIPTIADRLKAGKGIDGLALESALWCRYCFGTTDSGVVIEPNDPNWDRLQATAKAAKGDAAAWLAMEDIYGDVGKSRVFAEAFVRALAALWSGGTRNTLSRYVGATA